MTGKFHTVEEAAGILNTKPSTIRTYCREGKIPAIKIGRGYRIAQKDLQRWLEQRKRGSSLLQEEEERLIEAEARYRDLFENAGNAIVLFDVAGHLTLANPRFCELYGYASEEVEGMHFARFVYLDDLPLATERFMFRMAGEDVPSRYEARAVNKNGEVFPVEINSSSFLKEGKPGGVQAIIRDVSERKRAEKVLRESETRYRGIVEDQSELICRWLPGGKLVFVNDSYCRYFGKEKKDLVGHSFMPLIPEGDQEIVEEYVSKLTPKNPVTTYMHRVVNHKGQIRWIQWTDRLISNEKNNSIEYQSVGRDVTELREAQDRLRESEEMYKMLVKASPDSISMIDLEGNITFVSGQTLKLHGYKKAEELLGKSAFELVHPNELNKARADLQRTLKQGMIRDVEYTLLKKNGISFRGELSATLIRDVEQRPKAIITTVRDIAKRKKSKEEKNVG